jgi:hypothetical protein
MNARRLRRRERAAVYALLGTVSEVVFTAIEGVLRPSTRSARLEGHTYLWMPPIYGLCAVLYEPLHDRLRAVPAAQRAGAYAAGIIAVEYLSGRLIQRVAGVIPWDYTGRSRFQLHGATRFDYVPLWAAAGLALEPVDDALRSLRLRLAP